MSLQVNFIDMAGNMRAGELLKQQKVFSYILLCYSIASSNTFEDLEDWLNAVKEHPRGSTTPLAIIGTKSDLDRMVKESHAYNLQKEINNESSMPRRCSLVLETSAFEDYGSVRNML